MKFLSRAMNWYIHFACGLTGHRTWHTHHEISIPMRLVDKIQISHDGKEFHAHAVYVDRMWPVSVLHRCECGKHVAQDFNLRMKKEFNG